MMKRFLIILTAFLVLCATVACGPGIPVEESLEETIVPVPSEDLSQPAGPSNADESTEPASQPDASEAEPASEPDEPSEPEPSDEPASSEPEPSDEPEPSVPPASSDEPSEAGSQEPSEESEEPAVPVKTWPTLSGTFIQPGSFSSFTVERW